MYRSQYDGDVRTWSPQGRLFQVEYAMEAENQGSTVMVVRSKTHVVSVALMRRINKMADYTAYDECLSAYSTELGTNSVGGGSGSLSNQYDYTVTAEDLAAGTIYFACSYYPWYSFDHCVEGRPPRVESELEPAPGAGDAHVVPHDTRLRQRRDLRRAAVRAAAAPPCDP